MAQRYLLILFFAVVAGCAVAQNGSIAGQVLDVKSSEAIIGANVVIQGTTVGSATDVEGNFSINNLKPDTYTIVVTYIAYKSQTITDVVVEQGKKTTIHVSLVEDIAELDEVVVTARKEIATDANLINAIRESKLVVSGISSEMIVRLPDRDAAQIAQRVPGITIVDNRFILIRGVPDRYNQVLINGAIAPSTEIDKRSFSFDLIPAGAIDQMLVYKSGTAEMPGDFAGGVIQMVTKQPAYEPFTSIGFTFGYRTGTTFSDFVSSQGSKTDIFGFDNGFRDLPESFPGVRSLDLSDRNSSVREKAGRSLTNNFATSSRIAPIDMGVNITTSQGFNVGHVRFNNVTSLAYSNTYQNYSAQFVRYEDFLPTTPASPDRFQYNDKFYANDVRINAMHNWQVELNDRNRIEFKNLFVQLGENETTIREGEDYKQNPNFDRRNYAYHYLSRTIYSGQLEGTHEAGKSSKFTWMFGMNRINRNEPDFRRFRTYRDKTYQGTEQPYEMQFPAGGNIFETGRFWSDLKDFSYSNALNFEKKFGESDKKRVPTLKAGYYAELKTRTFNARTINYLLPGSGSPEMDELKRIPLDQIFSPANIRRDNGIVIEDATEARDHYEGSNLLTAGYVSGLIPVGKFDLTAGFRGEYNQQKIQTFNSNGSVDIDNPVFAPLPFLNVAYNISDRSLVRVAYSRTVNRPEFRELAPFLYYQFDIEASVYGNPDLKTAFINNIDLRYEMYPNPGEAFSIGAFYKNFTNPIESFLQVTSDNPQFSYGNAQSARNFGVELELKKSLSSLGLSKLLRNTAVNLNAAYIKSEVDIGAGNNTTNLQRYRPLQGQSPYIINVGVYYTDDETGFSANAAYNVFGPRIFSVGDINFPSWWEMPRHSMDFQVARKWTNRFETKLNIQNVLNSAFRFYQDNNQDKHIASDEALIQKYRTGSFFTVGLNWKFTRA
jgi:outer membrane cobalamin receptor